MERKYIGIPQVAIETVSFDKIDGVWTYNSTDVWQAQ